MSEKSSERAANASTQSANGNASDGPSPTDSKSKKEDFGYFFFPERGGRQEKSFFSKVFEGRSVGRNLKCLSNVNWCVDNNPMVKLMMSALKSHGCPVTLGRHISCEDCNANVNGGFDPTTNQVVVCQNNSSTKTACCSVIVHELTHMFDYCRAKLDFNNLEHLACTEIRAANLHHCSMLAAMMEGDTTPINFQRKHQECVRRKALMSVLIVRNISVEEGTRVVDKVFNKCYNDLEPVGRRVRRKSPGAYYALSESYLYGYGE